MKKIKEVLMTAYLLALIIVIAVFGQSFLVNEHISISKWFNVPSVLYLLFTVKNKFGFNPAYLMLLACLCVFIIPFSNGSDILTVAVGLGTSVTVLIIYLISRWKKKK